MKLLICSTVLALAVLVSGTASAGDLVIGHVSLYLGMPQGEALAALSKEFDAKQVSVTEGKYLLWTREPETGLHYSAGTVSFKYGKLYRASKFWGGEGVKGKDTNEGLFGALAEMVGKDGRACRIKAETLRPPAGAKGVEVRLVTIELPPDRILRLQIFEPYVSADGKTFESGPSVDEFLVALPTTK